MFMYLYFDNLTFIRTSICIESSVYTFYNLNGGRYPCNSLFLIHYDLRGLKLSNISISTLTDNSFKNNDDWDWFESKFATSDSIFLLIYYQQVYIYCHMFYICFLNHLIRMKHNFKVGNFQQLLLILLLLMGHPQQLLTPKTFFIVSWILNKGVSCSENC